MAGASGSEVGHRVVYVVMGAIDPFLCLSSNIEVRLAIIVVAICCSIAVIVYIVITDLGCSRIDIRIGVIAVRVV